MAFNSLTQILQDIADTLKVGAVANLQTYYTNYATEWQGQAYLDIVGILAGRKYTLAQILAADSGPFWERSLTRWYVFTQPQTQGHFDPELVKAWDVRPTLRAMTLLIGGQPVAPGASGASATPGEVGVGGPDTSGDTFVWQDPNDDRLGQFSRW